MTESPQATAAAQLLVAVRRGAPRLAALPAELVPQTLVEAYAIQHAALRALHTDIAGWKATLLAAKIESNQGLCAPLGARFVVDAPAFVLPYHQPTANTSEFGIEPELAFRLGSDLPPLGAKAAYSRASVSAAIISAHATIEVVVSRFLDPTKVTEFERVADACSNEVLVVGPSLPSWRQLSLTDLPLRVCIDGIPVYQGPASHPLKDPLLPVVWLANHVSGLGRGLRAGELITTGSCNGLRTLRKGQSANAYFTGLGAAQVQF